MSMNKLPKYYLGSFKKSINHMSVIFVNYMRIKSSNRFYQPEFTHTEVNTRYVTLDDSMNYI